MVVRQFFNIIVSFSNLLRLKFGVSPLYQDLLFHLFVSCILCTAIMCVVDVVVVNVVLCVCMCIYISTVY